LLARERERIMRDLQTKAPDPPPDSDVTDPADKATDTYDAELDESFADGLREQLEAVERAEQRLADGTYGLSIESGEPIPDERLELEPTAERTVVEQDRFDRGF
jgi:DnaK suppressor protein